MRRIAIAVGALLLSLSSHATLVAVVPARDGLAVAADSRFTFMGAACDGAFKIIEPERPLHTVAFVTGDSIFVAPPPDGPDPCRYLATAPRLLDMGAVVKAYLERGGDDPARISTAGLGEACAAALRHFARTYPGALASYAGREIVSVVVVSYDPARHVSVLRHFVVRIGTGRSQRIQAARISVTALGPENPHGVWIFGEAAYVNSEVYAGPGRRFLAPAAQRFLRTHEPIAALTADDAAAIAVNVVQAASRAAEIIPPPSGIGGPVRTVILTRFMP